MNHSKSYVVDTNVLLDDPSALFKLRNGNENHVFIPYHVLLELNKFKKDPRLGHIVSKVIQHLSDHPDQFTILTTDKVAQPFLQQGGQSHSRGDSDQQPGKADFGDQ
jgi:PhoH-like ATPase